MLQIRVTRRGSGLGLQGIAISFPPREQLGTTDEHGFLRARVPWRSSGTLTVRYDTAKGSCALTCELEVPEGKHELELAYEIDLVTIRGYALDQDAKPLPGATIRVWGTGRDGSGGQLGIRTSCISDEAGRFELGILRTLRSGYKVGGSAPGYRLREFAPVPPEGPADIEISPVFIKLEYVEGIVSDEAGTGIPLATGFLICFENNSTSIESMPLTCDERGRFKFPLFERKMAVSFVAHGYLRGTVDLGWVSSNPKDPIRVVLVNGSAVTGILRDESSRPIGGALIRFVVKKSSQPEPFRKGIDVLVDDQVTTDAEGRFTSQSLALGTTYRLEVRSSSEKGAPELEIVGADEITPSTTNPIPIVCNRSP